MIMPSGKMTEKRLFMKKFVTKRQKNTVYYRKFGPWLVFKLQLVEVFLDAKFGLIIEYLGLNSIGA